MPGGTTYYNQPGMHVTRASVPLAGTSHVYRVTEVLWPEAVEAVIESLLVGRSLHVCCGKSLIGDVRQDLYEPDADIQCDAADMSAHVADDGFDTVLCDPPYNGDLGWNHRLLKELSRIARQRIVFCHWFLPVTSAGGYKKAQDKFLLTDVYAVQPRSYFGRAQLISVYDRYDGTQFQNRRKNRPRMAFTDTPVTPLDEASTT